MLALRSINTKKWGKGDPCEVIDASRARGYERENIECGWIILELGINTFNGDAYGKAVL